MVSSPNMRKLLLIFAIVILVRPVLGACHTVSPNGSGSKTGADWNNAYAGLPSTLVRGDIYYLADGVYGNHLSITTPLSGTKTIELRKAQSYDNGSGCSPSIAAGWNTSTMGNGQAIWRSTGSGTIVSMGTSGGYLIFNGNGNNAGTNEVGCGGVQANPPSSMKGAAPHPAACGILIDNSTCTSTATDGCDGGSGVMNGGGPGIVWKSVEWFGQGLNSNGNNNSETYFWFASGSNLSGVTISHSYIHNASTTNFTVVSGGWNNGIFDHNYSWGLFDGSVNHGEAIQLQGSNGGSGRDVISNNIFRDQQTNGDVVAVIAGSQTYDFYNNVDFCSTGGTSTSCRHNDGVIGCFNSQTCSDVNVYDNTFSFPSNCGYNISGGPSTMNYQNNLFFNCGSVGRTGGTVTIDYNTYLNSSQSAVGTHDVSVSSGAANPFVNSPTGNVRLTADSSNYNKRLSLGSPYDSVDLYGNPFSDDRGANQYTTSGATKVITISGNLTFNSGTYQ